MLHLHVHQKFLAFQRPAWHFYMNIVLSVDVLFRGIALGNGAS